jgi:hypothetical protein
MIRWRNGSGAMRIIGAVVAAGMLAGCTAGLAERQAELSKWVGQPEAQLVAAMGAPNRVYDSGAAKFLTYEDVYVEEGPVGPYYFGPGPAAPTGYSGQRYTTVCDTTFTVAEGVVKAFSFRGNGCG